jgi:hypothetical protein
MDERSPVAVDETGESRAETFSNVVSGLSEWDPDEGGSHAETRRVRAFLEATLNEDSESPWERDIVERRRGSAAADLSVNGEIGVALVDDVGPSTAADLRVALPLLAERYNFIVVYWLDASSAGADYRRSVERGVSTDRLDVTGLRFVTARRPGRTAATDDPLAPVAELRGLVTATLLLVFGIAVVGWALHATTGLGRTFLAGVAGLFVGTLALATFIAGR